MKKAEQKQLLEALTIMKGCLTTSEVMAERAKERDEWASILTKMQALVDPLELYGSVWENKYEGMSERQQESVRGEAIADVSRKYEEVVDHLRSMIYDIEYILEYDI
jgi:hypothetical protein